MRAKRIRLIILIIIIIFIAAGCWDSRDVEDKDIAISVAVDKTDEGYAFYIKIASISTGEQGGSQAGQPQSSNASSLLIGTGESYIEARENIDRMSDNPIFLGAVQAVILTEKLAYSGIEDYILRIRQTPEYRKTLDVVITDSDPAELLNYKTENAQSVGFAVDSTIKSLIDTGQTFPFSLGDLLMVMASPNKCYLMHMINLAEDVKVTGYAVFDNGVCKGFIPMEDGKGILFLKTDQAQPLYNVPYSNGTASIKVRGASKSITPIFKDGKISFNVDFDIDAQVLSLSKNIKISKSLNREIGASLEAMILDDVSSAVTTSQSFDCDYLDFYTAFRIAYPEEVKSLDWKKEYMGAAFNISVNAKLDIVSTVNYSD